MKNDTLRDLILIGGILLLSIPLILPYFHPGFFPTHDGEWAVVRLADMFRELKDHQFPPRYSGYLNYTYGYPVFNFDYPFPYYLGAFIHALKFNFVDSIKIMFALSVPLSGIGMYLLSEKVWKSKIAGLLSAVLYMYLPYRLVDLYVRGSIGESLSFVLFPLLFYCGFMVYKTNKKQWAVTGAILYGILIMTHNIMSVLFTISFVFLLLSFGIANRKAIWKLLILFIGGILLSSFFIIPALAEKNNVLLSIVPIADRSLYWVSLKQLVIPSWGYGTPTDKMNSFTYQLGIPQVILLLIGLLFLTQLLLRGASNRATKQSHDRSGLLRFVITKFTPDSNLGLAMTEKVALLLFGLIVILLLMMFSFSNIVWQLPLLREINYPWILLGVIGFLISFFAGFLMIQNKIFQWILVVCSILSVILFIPYAHPYNYVNRGDDFYITNQGTTTSSSEVMPLWVKQFPTSEPRQKVEFLSGNGNLFHVNSNSKLVNFTVHALTPAIIRVNTIYYPGWNAYVDGKKTEINYNNPHGVMDIPMGAGTYFINFNFTETPLRLSADILSVAIFVILMGYLFTQFQTKKPR